MSLSLVEPDNLVTIHKAHVTNIAAMARQFADDIEAGDFSVVHNALVVIMRDDGLTILTWGEGASPYEMMGAFEAAKLNVFADTVIDEG